MDNTCFDKWIVRYTCHEPDGSYRQFHIADFDTKKKALDYIRKRDKVKLPNEEYTLIDNAYEKEMV